MTVCIVASCMWTDPAGVTGLVILAASDRMITARNVEYEPPQSKIGQLSKTGIVLVAGDIPAHSAALQRVNLLHKPSDPAFMDDLASSYAAELRRIGREEASHLFLSPLGLDEAIFKSSSALVDSELLVQLASQMQGHQIEAESIVAGVDERGAHIWAINNRGIPACFDDVGFVAIGGGGEHAQSHLMTARFSRKTWNLPKTLLLLYSAKKRAEVAPGVGRGTDMYAVFSDAIVEIKPEIIAALEREYEKKEEKKQTAEQEALGDIEIFINNSISQAQKTAG